MAHDVETENGKKWFKWTVEFKVSANWIADGFDLTNDRAKEMIENDLIYSYPEETQAKVINAPSKEAIDQAYKMAEVE